MATTLIRQLPLMGGSTDLASSIDDTYNAALSIIDGAAFHVEGTLASRPTAASAKRGTLFLPTDLPGFLYMSDGTNWVEVAPGMGSAPVGASMEWWSADDPADTRWVKMDGRALSTTTYAELYARFGSAYDTMHGATAPGVGLFRIPNPAGHAIIGAGTSPKAGISARTLGATLGEESHILTVPEIPSHNHSVSAATTANGFSSMNFLGQVTPGGTSTFSGTGSTGGGGSHNNMQPSIAAHRILRIA